MVGSVKATPKIVEYSAKHKVIFDENLCKGCELCVWICPKKILEQVKDRVNHRGYNPITVKNIDDCIACGMCAIICPDSVIKVERDLE